MICSNLGLFATGDKSVSKTPLDIGGNCPTTEAAVEAAEEWAPESDTAFGRCPATPGCFDAAPVATEDKVLPLPAVAILGACSPAGRSTVTLSAPAVKGRK